MVLDGFGINGLIIGCSVVSFVAADGLGFVLWLIVLGLVLGLAWQLFWCWIVSGVCDVNRVKREGVELFF